MKKLLSFILIAAFVPMLLTTGCKKEAVETEYEVLTNYLIDNDLDISDVVADFTASAASVVNEADGTVPNYYVIDLRSAEHFAAGHIKGAVNSTLANILTTAASAGGKQILVVCYTGQTAAHGAVALRLSGYKDAKILLWGMAGWNNAFASSWTGKTGDNGNDGVNHTNWTYPASIAADTKYNSPEISSTESEGAAILKERVQVLLSGGFKGIDASTVLTTPTDYFINNYWALADTEKYGHIKGAHRINPLTLENGEISNLDPNKTVVTYCWTGQTSSMVTAYLTVLGYDAKSLKFGANNMIYSTLESHKYTAPAKDYIYVTN